MLKRLQGKKILAWATALVLMAGAAFVTPVPSQAFGSADFLKTDGTVIRNSSGTGSIVNLRGTNLGGWLLQENWMSPLGCQDESTLRQTLIGRFGESTANSLIDTYQSAWITGSDLDNIKGLGMNMVRVPVYYRQLMDDSGSWRSDGWNKLDWLISQCGQRNLYVIIDLHGAVGGQNKMDNCGRVNSDPLLWKNSSYQDMTVALWEGIADRYKSNPTVAGYDLLNEPDGVGASQLNAYYDRLYDAVRAIDPNHMIFMEGAWFWSQLTSPSVYGWQNVVYEMHFYAMEGNQATDWGAQNSLVESSLQGVREHQQGWNVPIYVGEFNLFDFYDLWAKFLSGLNNLNASWSNWTYKVSTNYGNWGFYNNNPAPVPNIYSDSPETIASKWGQFVTSNSNPNTALQNLFKQYTGASAADPGTDTGTYYALVSAANGKFVTADNAGTTPLAAIKNKVGYWEMFKLIYNSDGTISLQSRSNDKYVYADVNDHSYLTAQGSSVGTREKFEKVDYGNGQFALKSVVNGKYVTADLDNEGLLTANRAEIGGAWETFTLRIAVDGMTNGSDDPEVNPDQYYVLISKANDKFVTADNAGTTPLAAIKNQVGYWEMFQLVHNDDGTVSFRSRSNDKYVYANLNDQTKLIAQGGGISSWERFEKEDYGNGEFALKSMANGKYVTADLDDGGILKANRDSVGGAWETFTLKKAVDGMTNGSTDPDVNPNQYYAITSKANNKFVSADNAGSTPLAAVKNVVGYWEMYKQIKNSDGTISLQSRSNDKYVTVKTGEYGQLIASASSIGNGEKFQKEEYGNGEFALKSVANGKYVTADLSNGGILTANRSAVGGAWESFTMQKAVDGMTNGSTDPTVNPDQYYAIAAKANNKIVCADNAGSTPLAAVKNAVGDWEMFKLVNNSDGTVSFLSKSNGKYVYARLSDYGQLIAYGTAVNAWERFQKVDYGNGEFALKCVSNGKYVTTDLDNGGILTANRDAVGGAWETFKLIPLTAQVSSGSAYFLQNKGSGKVLDVSDSSTSDGGKLIQYGYNGNNNQKFRLYDVGSGCYKLIAQHSNKAVDVPNSSTSSGVQLQQWEDNGTDAQKWKVISVGDGYVSIVNKGNGLAVTVSGGSTSDRAQIVQQPYTGSDAQKWLLIAR